MENYGFDNARHTNEEKNEQLDCILNEHKPFQCAHITVCARGSCNMKHLS